MFIIMGLLGEYDPCILMSRPTGVKAAYFASALKHMLNTKLYYKTTSEIYIQLITIIQIIV